MEKAIYAAAAVASSAAFVGYVVAEGRERHMNILKYHTRSVIEKNPVRGEEFAVNMAREALRHEGKDPKEFSVFFYSKSHRYTDPKDLKELSMLYKIIKKQ